MSDVVFWRVMTPDSLPRDNYHCDLESTFGSFIEALSRRTISVR